MSKHLKKSLKIRLLAYVEQEPEEVAAGVDPTIYGGEIYVPVRSSRKKVRQDLDLGADALLDMLEANDLFNKLELLG